MPLGIGKLTRLRTLEFFNVGLKKGRRIDELGCLKNLKCKLTIRNLENVVDKEEALCARLAEKSRLQQLELVCSKGREGNNNDENVLEGLETHPNLRSLTIENFKGDQFPSWVMRMTVGTGFRLDNLIEIELSNCGRCRDVPTLGDLPRLKILTLDGLQNVKSIGPAFYHPHDCQQPPSELFPADMDSLEEWADAKRTSISGTSEEIIVFPRLKTLDIFACRQLKSAPSFELELYEVHGAFVQAIIDQENVLNSLLQLRIHEVSDLFHFPSKLLYNTPHLTHLELVSVDGVTDVELPPSLESIHTIYISECKELRSISSSSWPSAYPSLSSLRVEKCFNLASLPDLRAMPSLSDLDIVSNPNLIEGYILPKLPVVSRSLTQLTLKGSQEWDTVPDQIRHLSTLTLLRLLNFGMEALPEWFGNLSSLKELYIRDCEKLRYLPSKEAMQRLTKLKILSIRSCPSFARDTEVSKILRIRHVKINGDAIQTYPPTA